MEKDKLSNILNKLEIIFIVIMVSSFFANSRLGYYIGGVSGVIAFIIGLVELKMSKKFV